jgi:hypothetical protein
MGLLQHFESILKIFHVNTVYVIKDELDHFEENLQKYTEFSCQKV